MLRTVPYRWTQDRWTRALIPILCILFAFSSFSPASANHVPPLRFERVSLQQGLSQSSVYAILQDQIGFLWFGTEGGLNKYDGYQFTIYKHDPQDPSSLSSNVIWALEEDRAGRLWVGTAQGLDRFDRESGSFVRYVPDNASPSSLHGTGVWSIFEDSQGMIWAGTSDGGLNRLDPQTGSVRHYHHDPGDPDSLAHESVKAIYEDSQGSLWVGTDAGIDRLDRGAGTFTHYPLEALHKGNPSSRLALSFYEDRQGTLWAGTNGEGLHRYDREGDAWVRYANDPDDASSLSADVVWGVLEDRSGNLWVGTDGGGLNLFDRESGSFSQVRHNPSNPESLSSDAIRSLFEDRSGVFWVGTYGGGLSKSTHNTAKFRLFRSEPGRENSLSDNYIWSIFQEPSGVLWLGTFQGGLNRFDRAAGATTVYQNVPNDPHSLSSNDVRAVLIDSRGDLWAGTGAAGLNRFRPGLENFEHFNHDPANRGSLGSDQIRALYEDRQGNLWVGTFASGLDRFDRQRSTFTHYRHDPKDPNSLASDRVRAILQDQDGALWVGTSGGLSRLDISTGRFTNYLSDPENPNSLSQPTVFDLHQDRQGALWIATFGGGLNRFDPQAGTFRAYTEADGLPHNQVYSILEDAGGYLWLSTNNGLSRFDPRSETFHNFGIQDGLQNVEFNLGASFAGRDGELFFGGIDGLNAFFPDQVRESSYAPPVVVTAFQKFNQTMRTDLVSGDAIELTYRDNFFSFEFAALDYNAPPINRYAYMLEGFDQDWVEAGTRRYASYTNLGGGEYTFRVRGTNSDGIWNETASEITVTIIPPFWETWWFSVLLLGSLAGGTVGVFSLRARNFRNQKERLEAQVAQRTAEIERRRKVAESLRDTLTILNSNRSLEEILAFISDQTVHLLACDGVAIYRLDAEKNELAIQASIGLDGIVPADFTLKYGEGVTGKAVQERRLVALPDTSEYFDVVETTAESDERRQLLQFIMGQYNALLSAPLSTADELYGALTLYYNSKRAFTNDEIELAATVAEQVALAIETARLRLQAGELAVAAERNRLARELHDAVTQTLFSSSLLAEVLPKLWERNPAEGRRRLEELRQLNRGALAEMRSLLLELRPTALLETDFRDLFRHLSEAFTGRARVPVELAMDLGALEDMAMPAEVKVALYRISQEALNNIIKHAQASAVTIGLRCNPQGIQLWIQDDGQGFEQEEFGADHLGLSIMRERAVSIGADLKIDSQPGVGTRIEVNWQAEG